MTQTVQPKRILVATDFSHGAEAALAWAQALAAAFRAEMILLHVLDLSRFPPNIAAAPTGDEMLAHMRADNEQHMAAMVKRFPGARPILREGMARSAILEVAAEVEADLIVMGTHGHTGLSHVFFGSVAEHVVRHSRIPVLTVRQNAR
jgi:nucleotide-binding universal stress UspA family protein